VAIAAKTAAPHPTLLGTIHTAAEQIEKAGGKALPLVVDVRHDSDVIAAVEKTVATFGWGVSKSTAAWWISAGR